MAHTKAAGAAKRTVDVPGKRLGVKKFGGQVVRPGNIIIRQHGTHFHAGLNTMLGRDYTIFAVKDGAVSFRKMTGYKRGQKWVDVVPTSAPKAKVTKAAVAQVKAEVATPKAAKATVKKPAVKKSPAKAKS